MSASTRAFDAFDYQVRTHGKNLAVSDESGDFTFADLNQYANRVINGFRDAGLQAGDRVAVIAKNRVEMVGLILASMKGGPVLVPVNRRISADEMQWIIRDADCKAIIADVEVAGMLNDDLPESIPDNLKFVLDPCDFEWQCYGQWLSKQHCTAVEAPEDVQRDYLQIYTSGTSGRPKGVVLTERNCIGMQAAVLATVDAELQVGQSMYEALPLFHVGGVFATLWALGRGVCVVLRQDFSPVEIDAMMASGKLQHAALVPAMIQACLAHTEADAGGYPELRSILYGASPIARSTLSAAVDRYNCSFMQVYGMTETHSVISVLTCEDHRQIIADAECQLTASAGRAAAGTELKICDPEGVELEGGEVGEICVRSQHIMNGYWKKPEATAESIKDGFLATGDAGYVDADGYLFIVDRLKDIIVTGGENVSSLEVESVIARHDQVADVAVIGVPDERWGETVMALVITKNGELDTKGLVEFCKPYLGGFKIPKRIEVVEAIPRNAAGKILKAQLRKDYWQGEGRRVS